MKRIFLISCGCILLALHHPAAAQTAIEKAEKRLAELLAPGSGMSAAPFARERRAWKASRTLDDFSLPIQPYAGVPVRLPQPQAKEVKPRSAPEGQPLVAYREEPVVPVQVKLPTKPLIKLPS